jgi:hypothetical protein
LFLFLPSVVPWRSPPTRAGRVSSSPCSFNICIPFPYPLLFSGMSVIRHVEGCIYPRRNQPRFHLPSPFLTPYLLMSLAIYPFALGVLIPSAFASRTLSHTLYSRCADSLFRSRLSSFVGYDG